MDLVVPQRGNPEVDVRIDPTKAGRVGLTPEQVATQLTSGLLGQVATSFRRGDRLIDVRVRYPDRQRFSLDFVREFPLTTDGGCRRARSPGSRRSQLVQGETQLFREDLRQMVPVTARLEGRDLGRGVRDVRRALAQDSWPVGTSYAIGGLHESQQASFRSLVLVLGDRRARSSSACSSRSSGGSRPRSWCSPRRRCRSSARSCLLLVTGTPLNVSSFMGLILLVGLIVKNGIILVDYADILVARGLTHEEALAEAGAVRLRPILMTTLCTLFGLLPLALGLGPGAELQKPLAIAVIGGLSVSTVITLLFVPTVLAALERRRRAAA